MTSNKNSHIITNTKQKANTLHKQLHCQHIRNLALNDREICQIITIFDKEYPQLLKNIYDAPLVLYTLGNTTLLNKHPSISVIGTRNPSRDRKSTRLNSSHVAISYADF